MNLSSKNRKNTFVATLVATFTMLILAIVAFAWLPSPAAAGTLGTDVIGLFPKDVSELAYADLKEARKHPWFSQLQQQMLPANYRQFEQFLRSAGMDPDTQIDEVAWGATNATAQHPYEIAGIALGSFSPSSTESRFASQKIPSVEIHGYKLWAFGSGSGPNDIFFFFLDSNTAAFGQRDILQKLINVRFGGAESLLSNTELFPLINAANGSGIVWAVLDKTNTQLALHQLLPQASQFPQASEILGRIHNMEIQVQADDGIDAKFKAVCDSSEDANQLAAMLQGGIVMRRYQIQQSDPVLAQALESVTVSPSGNNLNVEMPVTNGQLNSMIRTRTFAFPM
ncbi:MAG TPA: hypothetical protein VGU63_05715 [Candidatus Acidoferrales bacterium]|nr:hypothetical protein [Candidatus Acidoferrales bacterium]